MVSIHTNGGSGRAYYGKTQTFFCDGPDSSLSSRLLAYELFQEVRKVTLAQEQAIRSGGCDKGVLKRAAQADVPNSLIEVLYHTNEQDEVMLADPEFLKYAGLHIAYAIHDYITQQ